MMTNDPLREQLRRLAQALQPHGINLIVGGGYGLLLRTEHIRRSGARTRFAELLIDRSTNDIDIFLGAEVITDAEKWYESGAFSMNSAISQFKAQSFGNSYFQSNMQGCREG